MRINNPAPAAAPATMDVRLELELSLLSDELSAICGVSPLGVFPLLDLGGGGDGDEFLGGDGLRSGEGEVELPFESEGGAGGDESPLGGGGEEDGGGGDGVSGESDGGGGDGVSDGGGGGGEESEGDPSGDDISRDYFLFVDQ
ncbi:hypothetical protein CASFOL_036145 [Castilleja foliolosa]|uniref:Uncharacterized protein n=1 Tax=Castilleja foliolosa TaxID=1961234 RepID=A0ABD3BUU7_9LAMI